MFRNPFLAIIINYIYKYTNIKEGGTRNTSWVLSYSESVFDQVCVERGKNDVSGDESMALFFSHRLVSCSITWKQQKSSKSIAIDVVSILCLFPFIFPFRFFPLALCDK